jgi:hypothetical protein
MSELIDPTPAESYGAHKVACFAWQDEIGRFRGRELASGESRFQFERVDGCVELLELLAHLVFAKAKFRDARDESIKGEPAWRIADGVQLVSELRETFREFASGEFRSRGKSHRKHQGNPRNGQRDGCWNTRQVCNQPENEQQTSARRHHDTATRRGDLKAARTSLPSECRPQGQWPSRTVLNLAVHAAETSWVYRKGKIVAVWPGWH